MKKALILLAFVSDPALAVQDNDVLGISDKSRSQICYITDGSDGSPQRIFVSNDGEACTIKHVVNGHASAPQIPEKPKHGEVLVSDVGDKFSIIVYRPVKGYTGEDSFRIFDEQANIISTINVTVQPLPAK